MSEIYEATGASCPVCGGDITRVTKAIKSWGGDSGAQKERYVCASGSDHVPFGWSPEG